MRSSLGSRIAALEFPPASFLIDRSEEAEKIASVILRAPARFVVLYGTPDSGKTDLVVRWVIPELAANPEGGRDVLYAVCAPSVPAEFTGPSGRIPTAEALRGDHVIIIDEFERVLTLPRGEQDAALDMMFEELASRGPRSIIVLMVDARHMNAIYALASYDTDATDTIHELPTLTADDALSRMGARPGETRIAYDADVLAAVRGEVEALGAKRWSDTFDLTKLIHTRALDLARQRGNNVFTLQDYDDMSRAPGILRKHLEHKLEVLDARNDGDAGTARAILERMLDASVRGTSVDFAEVGPRIGTSHAEVERVAATLQGQGLLVRKRGGEWRVVPPQLLNVIEEDLRDRVRQIDRAQRTVIEGLRDWRRQGTLLSAHRLAEVHAERRYLGLDDEQLRFMLQTAILHGGDECARYWVDRTSNRDDGLTTLFRTLVHDSDDVRRRSARFLRFFEPHDVVDRLLEVVLTDPSGEVREAAIQSLDGIAAPEVKTRLKNEAIMLGGKHRGAAIDALRIFRSDDVADFLKLIVNDRQSPADLRARAIRVLGVLDLPRSIDVLLDIALEDIDEDDRAGASTSLGGITPPELNRQILHRLEVREKGIMWIMAVVLSIVVVSLLVGMILWAAEASEDAVGLVFLAGIPASIIAGRLIIRIREQTLKLLSPLGILAVALFLYSAVTIVPFIHGLAHFTINRRRRAAYLFGTEVLGTIFVSIIPPVLGSIRFLSFAGHVYLGVGIAMLVAAYLYDVVDVLLRSLILGRVGARRARRTDVYQAVFANPRAATLVFDALERPSEPHIASAAALLQRFGTSIQPSLLVAELKKEHVATVSFVTRSLSRIKTAETVRELEEHWRSAGASLRRRIVSVFFRSPTEPSVAALGKLRSELPRMDRWKAGTAPMLHKFSVFPRPVLFGIVAVLPALVVIIVSGFLVMNNPAWSQLSILRRLEALSSASDQRPKIIAFLADAYPERAATDLATMFTEKSTVDSVHAALAQALTKHEVRRHLANDSAVVAKLTTSITQYAARLDSGPQFLLSLGVLEAAAHDSNAAIATIATAAVTDFITARKPAPQQLQDNHRSAIMALTRLSHHRAIPLLDSLLSVQRENIRGDASTLPHLTTQLARVTRQAALALRDSSQAKRDSLTAVLASLENSDSKETANAMDILQSVSDVEEALVYVRNNPASEIGYTSLVASYEDDPGAAAEKLRSLKPEFGRNVWMRKTLAGLYHEVLALTDTSYFRRSYEEMVELSKLPAYRQMRDALPQDFQRIESDFVEAAFSAHQPHVTDSLSQQPAVLVSDTHRLNAALFAYMGFAISGDRDLARDRLTRLGKVIEGLPPTFENEWLYPGTVAFIEANARTPQLKAALLALCREGVWYSKPQARLILKQNTDALR